MIIACPHCQTKYQVTYEAIGSAGRKVQCAHCQQAWQQSPLKQQGTSPKDKAAFEAIVEDGLDEAVEAEEKAVAAQAAKRLAEEESRQQSSAAARIDPALVRSRQRAFSKRQSAINAGQPLAKVRRATRVGLALLLGGIVAAAYFSRVQIVARYPAMAGLYETVGLGVNVVGLDFTNVTGLSTIRNGKDVLVVSAQILGLSAAATPVPDVVVTLLDSKGESIYAWSITPAIPDLMAGERATFDTQLAMPPGDVDRVRLSFAEGSAGPAPTIHAAPASAHPSPNEAGAEHAAAPHATPIPEHH